MQDILRRHGKVTDVLEVENQIAEVAENIEQMEATEATFARNHVSTIHLDLRRISGHWIQTAQRRTPHPQRFIDGFRSAADGSPRADRVPSERRTVVNLAAIFFSGRAWAWRRFAIVAQ